jgi:long-chain acyl-CoA synthetase
MAMGLHDLGVRRGDTVAVVGENEPEHFWAEYAAQSIGATIVSLNPDLTAEEMDYILADSGATIVVAEDQEQVDKALEVAKTNPRIDRIVYWDDKGMWSYDDEVLAQYTEVCQVGAEVHQRQPHLFKESVAAGRGSDIAVISYTSGTTGRPKGVIITYELLFDNAARTLQAFDIDPGAQYLTYIPPAWGTEQFFGMTLGLLVPLTVNFPEEPEEVQKNIRELAVEALLFSPRQWESLASIVQSRMLDAGVLRRKLFEASLRVGYEVNVKRLDGENPKLIYRLLYPLAELVALRAVRDNLGLVRARLALSGGSAMGPDVFKFFHAMGVPLRNIYGTSEMGLFTVHQGDSFDVASVDYRWSAQDNMPVDGLPFIGPLVPFGRFERLHGTGVALGLFEGSTYAAVESHIAPGELLVLYSDGITEAENRAGQPLEEVGLQALVEQDASEPPASMCAHLIKGVETYAGVPRFADDLTVLVLKRNARNGAALT